MKPIISVIVPVYNASNFIANCVDSILRQTIENFEIILVNDGSTDDSLLTCQKYSDSDSRIKTISKTNGGVSSARNEGIKHSSGEFITFADADDYVSEDWLQKLYEPLKTNSDCDFSMCDYFIVKGKENIPITTEYPTKMLNREFIVSNIIGNMLNPDSPYIGISGVWNKLYRKSFIGNLRFDESLDNAEDWWFNFYLLDRANKIAIVNDKLYYYYVTNNVNSLTKKFSIKQLDSLIRTYPALIEYVEKYNLPTIKANSSRINNIITQLVQAKINLDNNEFSMLIESLQKNREFNFIFNTPNKLTGLKSVLIKRVVENKNIKGLLTIMSIKTKLIIKMSVIKRKILELSN